MDKPHSFRHDVSRLRDCDSPYDVIAERYDVIFDDENAYYGPINAREREVFESSAPIAHQDRDALDIGCGTGYHTQWLADRGYRTVGIDISREMLRVANTKSSGWRNSAEFIHCNALDMSPLGNRSFDLITCLGSTLNHIEDWRLFSRELSRRLRPGGKFLFSCDNILGVDTLVLLFKRDGSGYAPHERLRNFLGTVNSWALGRPFYNHWRMEGTDSCLELRLTYETMRAFRRYLAEAGINMRARKGVHLLTCFDSKVASASAALEGGGSGRRSSLWRSALDMCEEWLSGRFHQVCANIVGVAEKDVDVGSRAWTRNPRS